MVEMEPFGPGETPETTRETSIQAVSDDELDAMHPESSEAAQLDDGYDPDRELEHYEEREINLGEPPAEEAATEEPQAAEPAAEAEPATEEEVEEQPTPEDDEKEILRLKLIEAEAEAKRLDSVAGEHGGKIGFLERQLAELRAAQQSQPQVPQAPPPDQAYDELAGQPETPAPPVPQYPAQPQATPRVDPNSTYLVQQAISTASQAFAQAHADDVYQKDKEGNLVMENGAPQFRQEFMESLQPSGRKLEALLLTNNPAYAQAATQQILETAYWKLVKVDASKRRQEIERRSASQAEGMRVRKQDAGVTSSQAPASPAPKATRLEDVPDDQLDDFLDSHFGGE